MRVPYEEVEDTNLGYLLSQEEIPAYVRGLIKRAKTKKISLSDAMDEWFEENKNKFDNPKKEWFQVKKVWMDYADKMKSKETQKQKVAKFLFANTIGIKREKSFAKTYFHDVPPKERKQIK